MNYTENVIVPERTLLVSLDTGEYDAEESLRELWELAKSGGAEPIATMMQKRPSPETATCVGSGMVARKYLKKLLLAVTLVSILQALS